MIEVDGHNIRELAYAYRLAATSFGASRPTVVICHTVKGVAYGRLEGTADSHGTPLAHEEYVEAMRDLGFDIPGKEGDVAGDIRAVIESLSAADRVYLGARLAEAAAKIAPEQELVARMEAALAGRPMADYTRLGRPDVLPPELVFREGDSVPTRKATEAWFAWAMQHTAFFYVGAGDLMKSILTGKAENVYGVITPRQPAGPRHPLRHRRAEHGDDVGAMAQDVLPGGFRPMTAFATYGVFTPMMANAVRMTLINNAVNPQAAQLLHHAGGARRAGDRRGWSDAPRPVLDVAVHARIRASRYTNRWTPTRQWRCCSTRRTAASRWCSRRCVRGRRC